MIIIQTRLSVGEMNCRRIGRFYLFIYDDVTTTVEQELQFIITLNAQYYTVYII